jgi:TonB family protein
VEAALPLTAAGPRRPTIAEPVYTAPNPPRAITSHAVTADDYPADSIRLQEQGTVKLKYFIQTDGNVTDCQLIESSGFPRLDDAACVMVRKWQFKPATVLDGSPVALWMPANVVFVLSVASADSGSAFTTKDKRELASTLSTAQADAKAGRFAEALAKVKAADAMSGKPPELVRNIHNMIVAFAVSAKDYATALAQIDKNIAANEGNKNENLKQALSIATLMNDQAKVAEYLGQLGSNLNSDTRLHIAQLNRPNVGDLVNRPPAPLPPPTPAMPTTSHAVTVDDYPPDSVRLQEQGAVKLKYLIQTDGNVGDCQLIESSGFPRLDDAACIMVRKWKFKPATQGGRPVAVSLPAEVVFELR